MGSDTRLRCSVSRWRASVPVWHLVRLLNDSFHVQPGTVSTEKKTDNRVCLLCLNIFQQPNSAKCKNIQQDAFLQTNGTCHHNLFQRIDQNGGDKLTRSEQRQLEQRGQYNKCVDWKAKQEEYFEVPSRCAKQKESSNCYFVEDVQLGWQEGLWWQGTERTIQMRWLESKTRGVLCEVPCRCKAKRE